MTIDWIDASILLMASAGKPGRRFGTPLEYQEALKMRLRNGREERKLELQDMAKQLSAAVGREILTDTYRKWESESLLPHDTILAACDLIHVHVLKFLGPVTDEERRALKKDVTYQMSDVARIGFVRTDRRKASR